MSVKWHFDSERVYWEMSAPTDGWLAIGFNDANTIVGTYLIMGNIVDGKVSVVEYHTVGFGDYRTIVDLGGTIKVEDIDGAEDTDITHIQFSLPLKAVGKYQKNLKENQDYYLIMAYSREDDFQHHSMMRTHIPIKL